MIRNLLGFVIIFGCFISSAFADTGMLADKIVVSKNVQSEYSLGTPPTQDKNFEVNIRKFNGKYLSELIDLNQINEIVKPKEFKSKTDFKPIQIDDEIIISAITTGHIIPNEKMFYHLQFSREFIIKTKNEEVIVGIYYPPVGYIRFPDEESYWFLFSDSASEKWTGKE